ncbi:BQ2448_2175 [Microbotryum intermedium]|uniref:BQ2448_2175 protein n=1 Tax=Microbotryum intermedium TaxID=269621 RepID=A0A238F7H9_9BASI|nr:BQ2448_2175 [Microbotryum intermedium]
MIAERIEESEPWNDDRDAFTPVTHKKKVRNATPNGGQAGLRNGKSSTGTSSARGKGKSKSVIARERTLAERVDARKTTFIDSKYLEQCKSLLRNALEHTGPLASTSQSPACPPPTCAVCLGLGTLTASPKSQEQYLLLEALQDELGNLLNKPTEIYDPVFDPQDIEYLVGRGLLPLQTESTYPPSAQHDLVFDSPTLLYMPHCPRSLFDLLLERSWSRTGLKNLIILGNRLDMYDDPRHASATSSAKSPFIARAAPLFTIIALPPTKDHFQAFNDLALQWIPVEKLDQLPDDFFNKALPPPTHNDSVESGHKKARRREEASPFKGDGLSEALERVTIASSSMIVKKT